MSANDFATARTHYQNALTYFAHNNDTFSSIEAANINNNLGLMEWLDKIDGDLDTAAVYLNEALRLRQRNKDRRGMAETLNNLGILAYAIQNWEESRRLYAAALGHELELGDTYGVGRALNNLGEVATAQNDYARAIDYYVSALCIFRDVKSAYISYTEGLLSDAARATGLTDFEITTRLEHNASLTLAEKLAGIAGLSL